MSMGGRQRWLDGLRGIAAAIVAWFHFTVGEMKIPYRGFGDEPAEQNRRLIQLPPFRIPFAGKAMVTLFFVISGYSVPLAIIRRRGQSSNADCYRKLTSSVIRRGFRLYLPIIFVCITSQILFFMGAYSNWSFPRTEGCPRAPPWSATWQHLRCFALSFLSSIGFVEAKSSSGLNPQLWTMPIELKGSFAVYLIILGLLPATPKVRLMIVAILAALFLYFGFQELFCFFSGLLFAELEVMNQNGAIFVAPVTHKPPIAKPRWSLAAFIALFASGIYLLCLPYRGGSYEDYWYSSRLSILPYWDHPVKRINFWWFIGSIMLTAAIRCLPLIRKGLESPIAQFLGEISFSLYLLHQTFIRVLRNPILNWTCWKLWGRNFEATRADAAGSDVYYWSWTVAATFIFPLLVMSATVMTRTVNRRSIALTYQFEEWLSGR
ncbi:acyltransferase 3 [Aspergillus carlsbadensis]|nr:acyltransferase 3 [Aspergillus carlsbadensis]